MERSRHGPVTAPTVVSTEVDIEHVLVDTSTQAVQVYVDQSDHSNKQHCVNIADSVNSINDVIEVINHEVEVDGGNAAALVAHSQNTISDLEPGL